MSEDERKDYDDMTPEEQAEFWRQFESEPSRMKSRRDAHEAATTDALTTASELARHGVKPFGDPEEERKAADYAEAIADQWPLLNFDQRMTLARVYFRFGDEAAIRYGNGAEGIARLDSTPPE